MICLQFHVHTYSILHSSTCTCLDELMAIGKSADYVLYLHIRYNLFCNNWIVVDYKEVEGWVCGGKCAIAIISLHVPDGLQ